MVKGFKISKNYNYILFCLFLHRQCFLDGFSKNINEFMFKSFLLNMNNWKEKEKGIFLHVNRLSIIKKIE